MLETDLAGEEIFGEPSIITISLSAMAFNGDWLILTERSRISELSAKSVAGPLPE